MSLEDLKPAASPEQQEADKKQTLVVSGGSCNDRMAGLG